MRMAAVAGTAFWRMTLQASASSSGCGAISITLERISNVGAVKVKHDTLANRRESKGAGNLIQLSGEVLPLDRSEMAIDGLRPEDHEVAPGGSLHKGVSARRKKALLSFVPVAVEYTHYRTNVARDDFVRSRNNGFKSKALPVRG